MHRHLLLAVALLLGSIVFDHAEMFVNPPETYAPEWWHPFPNQRNAMIDFSSDPATWPIEPGFPVSFKDLQPGVNYDLEGNDDFALVGGVKPMYQSDYFRSTTGTGTTANWDPADIWNSSNRTGIAYWENATGSTVSQHVSGSLRQLARRPQEAHLGRAHL